MRTDADRDGDLALDAFLRVWPLYDDPIGMQAPNSYVASGELQSWAASLATYLPFEPRCMYGQSKADSDRMTRSRV